MIAREKDQHRYYHLITPQYSFWGTLAVNEGGAVMLYRHTKKGIVKEFLPRDDAAGIIHYFRAVS